MPDNHKGAFPRYVLVGAGTSSLDFILFSLLAVVFGVPKTVSNIISTIITVTVSYVINHRFVFRSKKSSWRSYFSFAGLTLFTGIVLQSVVIWTVYNVSQTFMPELSDTIVLPVAKIIAMGVGAVANFIGYRWIFSASK